MDETFSFLALWLVVGGIVGAMIGSRKGRAGLGGFLGMLFGFVGWLIIVILPDAEDSRGCPECFGKVPRAARKCMHCGSSLA